MHRSSIETIPRYKFEVANLNVVLIIKSVSLTILFDKLEKEIFLFSNSDCNFLKLVCIFSRRNFTNFCLFCLGLSEGSKVEQILSYNCPLS